MRFMHFFAPMFALVAFSAAASADSMSYPPTPTYIPSAIGAPVAIASTAPFPAYATYDINSLGTVRFTLSGTYTGLTAVIQGATERTGTPIWSTLGVRAQGVGTGGLHTLTENGRYIVDAIGFAQLRLVVMKLASGSVTVDAAGSTAAARIYAGVERRRTYSVAFAALRPAANASDFFELIGATGEMVRVQHAACWGSSSVESSYLVQAMVRHTADAPGTEIMAAQHDARDPAPIAVAYKYASNPITGNAAGVLRVGIVGMSPEAPTGSVVAWNFGTHMDQEVTLRGPSEAFVLNGNDTSAPPGTALSCEVQWTEE